MWTPEEWGQWALPGGDLNSCERRVPVNSTCKENSFLNSTQQCTSWIYETNNTIVAEVRFLVLQSSKLNSILKLHFQIS